MRSIFVASWSLLVFSFVFIKVYSDPGVKKDIGDVISLLYILAEHVLQKVNALIADTGPNSFSEARFCGQYSLLNLLSA